MSAERLPHLISVPLPEQTPQTELFTPEQINQIAATARSFDMTDEELVKEAIASNPDNDAYTAVQAYVQKLLEEI